MGWGGNTQNQMATQPPAQAIVPYQPQPTQSPSFQTHNGQFSLAYIFSHQNRRIDKLEKGFATQEAATASLSVIMQNVEAQIGKIALALQQKPQGQLQVDTQDPRRDELEQVNAVSLRNERQLEEMPKKMNEPNVETIQGKKKEKDGAKET